MTDRLTIINDALTTTGNNDCAEYDGSVEWRSAEVGYRRAVGSLLSQHRWNFAKLQWPLTNVLPDALSERRKFSFRLPSECLHIEGLLLNGCPFTAYEIVDGAICADIEGLTLRGMRVPPLDQWPLNFVELLTLKIEAHLYESLNEDQGMTNAKMQYYQQRLQETRTELDQQEPRRAVFMSRTAARRRGAFGRR